jgi:hypothetical protein
MMHYFSFIHYVTESLCEACYGSFNKFTFIVCNKGLRQSGKVSQGTSLPVQIILSFVTVLNSILHPVQHLQITGNVQIPTFFNLNIALNVTHTMNLL